jgi:septal ring factor EnvC (AmiA/AmiB activator)
MNFDTHSAVKHLHSAGLDDKIAEAIVDSIAISRKSDLSNLVSKDDFFEFKEEVNTKFNAIDKRFDKLENSILDLKKDTKADIDSFRKDTKADMDSLRKDVAAEIAKLSVQIANNKNDMLKWIIGLFIILMIAIFIRPNL